MTLPLFLQLLFLLPAGAALWFAWRKSSRAAAPLLSAIITTGFLLRALVAQALFWISYLHLPIGRSLQFGNGFWFYGRDGILYCGYAWEAAGKGLGAILTLSPTLPSVFYIKVVAAFAWALGSVTSTAILVNLFSYLGSMWLIDRAARRWSASTAVAAIPMMVISFAPSWFLWALQPLKDAFFCFLIILLPLLLDEWVAAWKRHSAGAIIAVACLLPLLTYAIAGIRWYYALVALAVALLPMCAIILGAHSGRGMVARVTIVAAVAFVMTQLIVTGAGPYLPEKLQGILRPTSFSSLRAAPVRVETVLQGSRANLDTYRDAGTRIRSGAVIEREEHPAATTARGVRRKATRASARPAKTVAPAAAAAPVAEQRPQMEEEGASPGEETDVPVTTRGRLIAGFSALVLPRWFAMRLGLIDVAGGRGFWAIAEIDTIVFDLLLLTAIAMVLRALVSGAWRDPLVWYLCGTTALMAGAIAYAISNFGTLFRHRDMIVATLALLPVVAWRTRTARISERREVQGPGAEYVQT